MEDLIFNVTDCFDITVSTPNTTDNLDLISEMQESPQIGSTHIRDYSIEISKNCCASEELLMPVFYNFTEDNISCSRTGGPTGTTSFGFSLSGINPLFIETLRISYDNQVTYNTLAYSNLTGNTGISYLATYDTPDVTISTAQVGDPPNRVDYTFFLEIVHVSGFTYIIEMQFTLKQPGGCNIIAHSIEDITYPVQDERIVFDGAELEVLPLFETPEEEGIATGVYQIVICRNYLSNPLLYTSISSNCVQNNQFIACDIICALIDKLVQCKDTNIFTYYDALVYANDCQTSYEDMCDLYEILTNKLNNPDCRDPYDDCNCGDSKDVYFQQRGYNNNKTGPRPCSTCNS